MSFKTTYSKTARKSPDTAILLVFDGAKLGAEGRRIDKSSNGHVSQVLKKSDFSGKNGETLTLTLPGKAAYGRVVLVGLGKPGKLNAVEAEDAGGKAFHTIERAGTKAVLFVDAESSALKAPELAARFVAGVRLRSYKFDKYKSAKKSDKKDKKLVSLDVVVAKHLEAEKLDKRLAAVAEGVFLARDLVNEPPNHILPDMFARRIVAELKPLGVSVEVLDEKKMKTLGMGAILAVGMGSEAPPRMVIMHWNGNKAKDKPLALVGKGVTFDTGGNSMKPAAGMEEMKMDMAGAAAVVGTMKVLATRKSKSNVVGIVGIAENMVSGRATRPSDIVTSYSGKTIEVLNTDAEGRLVLADALTYVQEKYKPKAIIDLATLTGAMLVALGHEYCGTFCNDNPLWTSIEKAAKDTGEKIWRMPLDELWKKEMESPVADLQNLAKSSRWAGSCTAAGFLEHFIENDTPWAHMDIAGTAWIKSDRATVPKFGTGYGVRTLERLVANSYEKK